MKNRTHSALLVLSIRPSEWMRRALLWVHVLALVALWLASLPWWLAALGSGGWLLSAWITWRKPLPLRRLQWGREGLWQLEMSQGSWVGARLNAHGSRSLPWWVFLDFRLDNGRRLGVTLLADSLSRDEFRRLRARLKVESAALLRDDAAV